MVIWALMRVSALSFWRDRAGMVLAFVLPPLVFLVFASVFGAGVSGKIDLRATVFDAIGSPDSHRLTAALRTRLAGRLQVAPSLQAARDAVASGAVDGGVYLRGDLSRDAAPIVILAEAGKGAPAAVLSAHAMGAAQSALPRLMLDRQAARLDPIVRFTPEQRRRLTAVPLASGAQGDLIGRQTLGRPGDPLVIYYAGGVSVLFLMFTAMQGAMGLIEERRAGIGQRLALSAGGVAPILLGRMAFLTLLGTLQALAVFVLAAGAYGVPLVGSLGPWSLTALLTAAASAGLALALATACRTREQAQTVSTFVILILAAVGGSMAPRFLMPSAMQTLGWATPNAWAIDAFQGVLWRRGVDAGVLRAWAALAAFAGAGMAVSGLIEGRRRG